MSLFLSKRILFSLTILKAYLVLETEASYQFEPCHHETHSCLKGINAEAGRTVLVLLSTGLGLPDVLLLVAVTCFPANRLMAQNSSKPEAFPPFS